MAFTDDDCRQAIRAAAAEEGSPLGIEAYRRWRSRQRDRHPADLRIAQRLGGWPAAVRAAEVEAIPYTPECCLDALRQAALDLGVVELRQREYRGWQADQEHRPERQAIVRHLGRWAEAVEAAGLVSARA